VKKKDCYAAGIDHAIEYPTKEAIQSSKAIIIFASSYNKEIIKELRGVYHYIGLIIYFEGKNVKVDRQ
jgi:hypothetical protein